MAEKTETVTADAFLGEDGAFQDGWLDNLPEDTFEKDDTGKLKQGNLADHKDIGSLIKSHLSLEKKFGTATLPLADDATPEQIKAHRAKVGCPETVEGYEIAKPEKLPEGMVFDDELDKTCAKFAHDNHMPKGVFEGLRKLVIDGQTATFTKTVEVATKDRDTAIETATNQLKGKYGAKYDEVVEMANRFYDLPGDDKVNKAFTDLMAAEGLNSHPAVLEFFHEAYKLVKEDTVPGGGTPPGKTTVPGQLDYSEVVGNSGR